MTPEEVKAVWAEKITTQQQFDAAFAKTRAHRAGTEPAAGDHMPTADGIHLSSLNRPPEEIWMLRREIIREQVGVYAEPTSILRWLRTIYAGAGQNFPHISKDDRSMVAYCPDRNALENDRQVRTTMGKLLRKFLLVVPDSEIQRLEQIHRGELDTSFKLAETVDAIEEVYRNMSGDSGCMRYGKGHFDHEEYHPSAVYAAPGMGVAYTTDADGDIASRSVVWVNPADPADKRYVRIYGDPVLKRKLEANGFRMAGLAGAKLAALRDPSFGEEGDMYVMPYVDPAGGIHSRATDRSLDPAYAVKFKGEDYITLITSADGTRYNEAGVSVQSVHSQSGHISIDETDPASFTFVCPLSGDTVNRLEVRTSWFITPEGEPVRCRVDAIDRNWATITANREGNSFAAWAPPETVAKHSVPGFPWLLKDAETMEANDIARLDSRFYEEERYVATSDAVRVDVDSVTGFILKSDAYVVHYSEGGKGAVHVSQLKGLRKEGYVPVSVHGGKKRLAHKENPRLQTTATSGRKVLTGVHDVVKLYDGRWEFSRNVKDGHITGMTLALMKDETLEDVRLSADTIRRNFGRLITGYEPERRERYIKNCLDRGVGPNQRGAHFHNAEGALVAVSYYSKPTTMDQIESAADYILSIEGDTERLQNEFSYNAKAAVCWAHVARQVFDLIAELRAAEIAEAEALAEEVPVPQSATPLTVEELQAWAVVEANRLFGVPQELAAA